MNILILGGGGREHALGWKIKQSKHTRNLYFAPGNAGTASVGKNIPVSVADFPNIGKACLDLQIDLVVVGPEVPLVQGVRDYFDTTPGLSHVRLVGPGKSGARLEGSKDFSKQFMVRHGIPTAKAQTFSAQTLSAGHAYLEQCSMPIVLKADGLAAGKGVIICDSLQSAHDTLDDMLAHQRFGDASAQVLIEEFLDGIEVSMFVLTDGSSYVLLPEAKDYKRIGDADTGPNTGGMGAVSPVPFVTPEFRKKVEDRVIAPTIAGLNQEGIPYRGFIFFGLIKVKEEPFVIEYNARMGDPETEAVMTRIKSDLVELLLATAEGTLAGRSLEVDPAAATTVVMVSGGYPGDFTKGHLIQGLTTPTSALVFHAGTKSSDQGVLNDGGRVLAITGRGATANEARAEAYSAVAGISWKDVYFRKDIGVDLLV
ncbi:MAG TPA: phosphoribosylamine--glycine ligase [Cyclobacteriaceae bacterium]|nr:phosphoribosylamine--glycine ligase [Cyclobacteriaceae bacterium]